MFSIVECCIASSSVATIQRARNTRDLSAGVHFDRQIVALILQKDLLDSSDAQLALPETDFRNIFRRGINDADVVTLSSDRRVLQVALSVKNGVDQIRVLVAAAINLETTP